MNFEDNFPERIDLVINKLNGPSEFARQTGVTLSTIARWRKGEAEPSRPNLIKIAEVANVSIEWLATGRESQPYHSQNLVERAFDKLKDSADEIVSMVNSFPSINVSAGFGSFNEGVTQPDGQEPYSSELLQKLGVQAEYCGVFWAGGRSMHPTIADGDQMLVSFKHKEVKGNNIYLVQNGDSVWVKRVKVLWDGVELISDNKEEYEPIKITTDEAQNLQIIGQVIHTGHALV